MLKKTVFLLVLAASILLSFTSCEQAADPAPTDTFAGSWHITPAGTPTTGSAYAPVTTTLTYFGEFSMFSMEIYVGTSVTLDSKIYDVGALKITGTSNCSFTLTEQIDDTDEIQFVGILSGNTITGTYSNADASRTGTFTATR